MGSIDYKELYSLQDKVLAVIFQEQSEFYLTGGTCLSRFYIEKRYSDDLDFFTNQSPRYSFEIKKIKKALEENFQLTTEVQSKDFTRFKVDGLLQLDFVNDISFRYKDVVVDENNYLLDNIENILSNKITAVIGRDNPKDIFDIYLIYKFYSFEWKEILDAAHEKAGFSNEELIIRLKSFPKELLHEIKIIDRNFLNDFDIEFPKIIYEIEKI
ncbi:nucleotidyl transferase AbiEii/AbiGii toxin family protein [Sulfurimonas sp.]|jgi:predicted nucleotidyltransferase component of viral defense system|uniref:nucleotidyl transferase AbiEii/AbiGii toxin family protein n=1 Tax=Sulfurimonas sp. TaxID=2022749 RepID=UPI0025FE0896|nr:nucleotidyl transferase AbiEii/AbiGii toxin family protein [Sulfurimonas sp.]MBT5935155.1 nucleotidyl transferase AbiEii/AbiGii toxin family protein [Sulfurimonas sp.]